MSDVSTMDDTLQDTLERYFELHQGTAIDFELRVQNREGHCYFYIHPKNVNGETWDFVVKGNQLTRIPPDPAIQNTDFSRIDKYVLFSMIQELSSKLDHWMKDNNFVHDHLRKQIATLKQSQSEHERDRNS